jgi:copper chaperone CopZ
MCYRKLSPGLILFILILTAISCTGNSKKAEKESVQQEATLIEVSIGGMSCTGCEQTIQTNVSKLEGIKSVKASWTSGRAIVEYFPGIVDTLKIKEAVTGSGYTVKKFMPVQEQPATQ